MILAILLAVLGFIFFAVRKNAGPALLAVIAGVAVYEMFGVELVKQIGVWMPTWDTWWIDKVIYGLLILGFPLLLYLRSEHGGRGGILRIAEAGVFAVLLTALLAGPLAEIFVFDELAHNIATWIEGVRGWVMVAGIGFAYFDVLFYRAD